MQKTGQKLSKTYVLKITFTVRFTDTNQLDMKYRHAFTLQVPLAAAVSSL